MSMVLTCRCGKQLHVSDQLAGKRIRCPACADVIDVGSRASSVPSAPASRDAVHSGAPAVRSRPTKPAKPAPPFDAALDLDEPLPSPVHRYVWLWISIAAVVPAAVVSVGFAFYLLRAQPADPGGAFAPNQAPTQVAVAPKQNEVQPKAPVAPKEQPVVDVAPMVAPEVQQAAPPVKVKVQANVHPQAKPPAQPKTEAQAGLTQRVHALLKASCYRCHGQDGENEGGLNYVADLHTLVSRNKVVPGKPDDSVLLRRITAERRPMPPKGEQPRPTDAEIADLKKWIEEGAPGLDSGEPDRDFISDAEILKYIHDDLQKIEERSRKFTRYFTITHLYNAGRSEDELQTFRLALSKLVNSLSWERDIEVPRPIDPAKTILRIDLRHYQWTADVWNRVLAAYPYAVTLTSTMARAVYALAECELPCARADWFVHAASRPPLYHDILQLPQTDRELERKLAVDADANIRNEKVARAGFNSSGVSSNNRLIERHRSGYGTYWKSYDFGGNQDRKNLFAYPLGPGADANTFLHDGGEIIFSLPNGLQGYLLTDERGVRIDKGPTSIVRDDRQPDRSVVNGVSCMSCHAHGMIDKFDQVREHVERNPTSFTRDVSAMVRALYPPREQLASLLKEDADRFAAAVKKTGAHLSTTEPIAELALRYTHELDLPVAAAEAGLDVATFLKLLQTSPPLARTLGPLNAPGGTVQRDVFVATFPELARLLLARNVVGAPQTVAPGAPAIGSSANVFNFIQKQVKANRFQVAEKGFVLGQQLHDVPSEGGILIGFNASEAKGPFGPQVGGLQPIYLTRDGEKTGQWIGHSAEKPIVVKAKPGYIVGAIHLKSGVVFDAFAMTFVRFEQGRMLTNDQYVSETFGGKGGNPSSVGTPGALIVGVVGRVGRGGNICSLGAVSVRAKD